MKVNKERAIELRQEGMEYTEIAAELGCSIAWCKKYLKGVTKDTKEQAALKLCVAKAIRPQGMTTVELVREIAVEFPHELDKGRLTEDGLKRYRRMKQKIRSVGGIIRPVWLKPDGVDSVYKLVIEAVDNLDRRLYEDIDEIIQLLDPSSEEIGEVKNSLAYQIASLSYIGRHISGGNVPSLLESLQRTVDQLRERVPQVPDKPRKTVDLDPKWDSFIPY